MTKTFRAVFVLGALLVLASCQSQPAWYTVPPQRTQAVAEEAWDGRFIHFADPRTFQGVVADIDTEDASAPWRWTRRNPTVRLLADPTVSWNLVVQGTFAEAVFQQTGAIRVQVWLDGKMISTQSLTQPGPLRWSFPIGIAQLGGKREHQVKLALSKVFIAPSDKAELGLILEAIGMERP